jgi:hypothetical protein
MKFSKVLLSSAVLAAAAVGFMGCADDDDPYEMIERVDSKNYTIDHTNEDAGVIHRGFRSTKLEHAGGTVVITFENAKENLKSGVMGFVFDRQKNTKNSEGRDFYVVGLRTLAASSSNTLGAYISRFENVTDMQAYNFGAPVDLTADDSFGSEGDGTNGSTKGAKEKLIVDIDGVKYSGGYDSAEDTVSVMVYVAQSESGDFTVYLLPAATETDSDGVPESLESAVKVADITTDYETTTENDLGVYANVYPSKGADGYAGTTGSGYLKGSWVFNGTYKESSVELD